MKFQNPSFNFFDPADEHGPTNKPKPICSPRLQAETNMLPGDINESSNQHIYLLTVQKFNVFLHLYVSWFDCEYGTAYTFQFKEQ